MKIETVTIKLNVAVQVDDSAGENFTPTSAAITQRARALALDAASKGMGLVTNRTREDEGILKFSRGVAFTE